jgi:hypothetical protein
MFEAASRVAKHIRKSHQLPFGGIRVILFGDFNQLSPIKGHIMFHTEEFLKHFIVRHLLKFYRTECEMTMKTINSLRAGKEDSLTEAIKTINSAFGINIPLGQSLLILDLILENLLLDARKSGNAQNFINRCSTFYDLTREKWGTLIIKNKENFFVINPIAKVRLIQRLEYICCDTTKVYRSNREFFSEFPTTLCAENSEVNFLNEQLILRGIPSTLTYHHAIVRIKSKEIIRTFFSNQKVVNGDSYEVGTVKSYEVGENAYVTSIVVEYDHNRRQTFEGKQISALYPYSCYMSNKRLEEDILNDEDIVKFTKDKNFLFLRKGQRFFHDNQYYQLPKSNRIDSMNFS